MTYRGLKTHVQWGVSAVALTTMLGIAGPAMAQVEELIVTAQKREQSLQEVPIAVAAFGTEFLENAGVNDIFELQFFTPGLVVENGSSAITTSIAIRGVGTSGDNLLLESSVGVYIDGVYRTRQDAATRDLIDVERVEVLKGPQGTLFGRNTASGAIQYITVAPEPEFGGWAEVEYGNLNYLNLKGALNVPIVEDVLSTRISGNWQQRDGYVDNILIGEEANDRDRYSLRAQALFTPNESVSFRLIGDYSELDEVCCTASNILDGPGDTNALFVAAGGVIPPTARLAGTSFAFPVEFGGQTLAALLPPATFAARFPLGFQQTLAADFHDDIIAQNFNPNANVKDWGVSGELNWEVNGVTLTSITAYRNYEAFNDIDADYNALDSLGFADDDTEQTTFSQEFRIAGSLFDRLEYVAGAYYFDERIENREGLSWGLDGNLQAGGGTSVAFFASVPDPSGSGFSLIPGVPIGPNVLNQLLLDPTDVAAINTAIGLDILGGHCASIMNATFAPTCANDTFPANSFANDVFEQDQESWALFFQADYSFTEQLIGTLGLRYNDEKKTMNVRYEESIQNPTFAFFSPFSVINPDVTDVVFDDTSVTGTAKITYFWTPEVMTYVSYGRGYKAGGTNADRIALLNANVLGNELFVQPAATIVTDPVYAAPQTFDPEIAKSWEAGLKGDFLGGNLRANIALFTTKFEDFQANSFIGNAFVLQNAGSITSEGVELDLTATPTDWLTLSASGAFIDAKYDSFVNAPCDITPYGGGDATTVGTTVSIPASCDKSGKKVAGTPELSWTGSARVERPFFNDVLGYSQLDVRWNDETPYGTDADPDKARDAFTLVNLRAGIAMADDRWDLSVWGKNIFDEDYYNGAFNAVGREGSLAAFHTDPRTYGITLRTRF